MARACGQQSSSTRSRSRTAISSVATGGTGVSGSWSRRSSHHTSTASSRPASSGSAKSPSRGSSSSGSRTTSVARTSWKVARTPHAVSGPAPHRSARSASTYGTSSSRITEASGLPGSRSSPAGTSSPSSSGRASAPSQGSSPGARSASRTSPRTTSASSSASRVSASSSQISPASREAATAARTCGVVSTARAVAGSAPSFSSSGCAASGWATFRPSRARLAGVSAPGSRMCRGPIEVRPSASGTGRPDSRSGSTPARLS